MIPVHNIPLFIGCFILQNAVAIDPEVSMRAMELISYNGYHGEEHNVTTADDFVLTCHRIPKSKKEQNATKGVVVIQHGFLVASGSWLMNGANGSLPFILADAGFDVWLPNSRGNSYSMNNRKFNATQDEFWNWSFDQYAEFDLPAVVDYILNTTKASSVSYVGHSQGALIAFALLSTKPQYQEKIKQIFALAPVAKVGHITGLLRFITDLVKNPNELYSVFGRQAFLANSTTILNIAQDFCDTIGGSVACTSMLGAFTGFDFYEVDFKRVPIYFAHSMEGTSVQTFVHYAQNVLNDKFQMYDFGALENMKRYNQTTPPMYDVTKIKVPVSIFHGGRDFLADPEDVSYLSTSLPNIKTNLYMQTWDHFDFVVAMDAPKIVFSQILSQLQTQHNKHAD